jgi:glycosyltransferase involved in cell wall biosynthesis
MVSPNQIAIVVPCLNEGQAIGPLVRQIIAQVPRVVVVDDGSTDGTSPAAMDAGATVVRHPVPRGKGAALTTGFRAALQEGIDWALAMDGDGQHSASDIPAFLRRVEVHPAAMIIGNRLENLGPMPPLRLAVNRWMSRRIAGFCKISIPDSQCGFRMVNLHAWKRFCFTAQHFEIESEMIIRFCKAGLPIDFVPVQTCYASEHSKIRPLRDTLRWFLWWNAIRRELAARPRETLRERSFTVAPQDAPA